MRAKWRVQNKENRFIDTKTFNKKTHLSRLGKIKTQPINHVTKPNLPADNLRLFFTLFDVPFIRHFLGIVSLFLVSQDNAHTPFERHYETLTILRVLLYKRGQLYKYDCIKT